RAAAGPGRRLGRQPAREPPSCRSFAVRASSGSLLGDWLPPLTARLTALFTVSRLELPDDSPSAPTPGRHPPGGDGRVRPERRRAQRASLYIGPLGICRNRSAAPDRRERQLRSGGVVNPRDGPLRDPHGASGRLALDWPA